ncbi:hypothetical protein [Olivibacter sitiensis]|uniref:hypothetical protein n=1 Tax=Olivibacter sitiensis TaxID=376470 RepID=UPI000481C19B|nr:hypothetical protein [Olivibacter sitiensis]
MERPHSLWVKFYENLAHLFYSIASCDDRIDDKEVASVKYLLNNVWLDLEPSFDEYGYDAAYQIEAVFDWLVDTKPSSEKAFQRFCKFVQEHPGFVDKKLTTLIIDSANKIAYAFRGRNKSELGLIFRLEQELTK